MTTERSFGLFVHKNVLLVLHYANMPMQYTAMFFGWKNVNFQMKNCDIFLIFAQNIDCGYTLEPPDCKPQFYYIYVKVGCKGVYITRTHYPDA